MASAKAIIIGVDAGPAIREYGLPELTYAEDGARQIAEYATALRYDVTTLVGPEATYQNVDGALREAADPVIGWETVLVVFSGHGVRKDSGMRCDYNEFDEHWCLHNELMVDDHLLMRMQAFAEGTYLFVVADCCFAGGGSGWEGAPMRKLLRHAANLMSGFVPGLPKFWENDVDAGRKLVRKDAAFNCSHPKAQFLLLASSDQDAAEAGPFMKAFLTAWQEPAARSTFRAFRDRMLKLGGRPVLLPSDSPLLDMPAFAP